MGGGVVPIVISALRTTFEGALDEACCGGAAAGRQRALPSLYMSLYTFSGFRIHNSGLRTQDSGLRTQNSGLRTQDSASSYVPCPRCIRRFTRSQDSGFTSQDSQLRTLDPGPRTQDSGLRIQDSGWPMVRRFAAPACTILTHLPQNFTTCVVQPQKCKKLPSESFEPRSSRRV